MSSDDEDSKKPYPVGPALPNTLASVLTIFPMAESRKRRHEVAETSGPVLRTSQINEILFPDPADVLSDSMDRVQVGDVLKKRKPNPLLDALTKKIEAVVALLPPPTKRGRKKTTGGALVPPTVAPIFLPPNELGVSLVAPYALFDYQLETVRWMLARERGEIILPCYSPDKRGGLLAMVMGLGKTPTAACLIMSTIHEQRAQKSCTLYVCPKNLLGTVRHQFEKFLGQQLKCLIFHRDFLRSDFDCFDAQAISNYDVIITNYETMVSRMGNAQKAVGAGPPSPAILVAQSVVRFPWFRVILDESHEIREKSTQKFKSMLHLNSPRRFCLTGTPIFNRVEDIFRQLEFTGLIVPKGLKCTTENLQGMELMKMIKFVEYKDAQCVKLPPKEEVKLYFNLSPEERFLHDYYATKAQKISQSADRELGKIKTNRTLQVRANIFRSMQVCSAPYLITAAAKDKRDEEDVEMADDGESGDLPTEVHQWAQNRSTEAGTKSSKMKTFVALVTNLKMEAVSENDPLKVVVFANYTSSLRLAFEAVSELYPEFKEEFVYIDGSTTTLKREEAYTQFRVNPKIQFLFMSLKLGSIGLNLSEANKVVMLETWFSYAPISQGIARCWRIGQIRPVTVYFFLARDSIEERMHRTAMGKKAMEENMMKAHEASLGMQDMRDILFDAE